MQNSGNNEKDKENNIIKFLSSKLKCISFDKFIRKVSKYEEKLPYYRPINLISLVIIIFAISIIAFIFLLYQSDSAMFEYEKKNLIQTDNGYLMNYTTTLSKLYNDLYNVMYSKIYNDKNHDLLLQINASNIINDSSTKDKWHGAPKEKAPLLRNFDMSIKYQFNQTNNRSFLAYIIVAIPNCEMYVIDPWTIQQQVNQTQFKDHPWCSDLHIDPKRVIATVPYTATSLHQKVSTVMFPIYNYSIRDFKHSPNITVSYIGGALSLYNITNTLLYKNYNLDINNDKLLLVVDYPEKYHHKKGLFEPMDTRIIKENSTFQNDDEILNKIDTLDLHSNIGKEIKGTIDNHSDTYFITYANTIKTIKDNDQRDFKWTMVFMRSHSSIANSHTILNNPLIIYLIIGSSILIIILSIWISRLNKKNLIHTDLNI